MTDRQKSIDSMVALAQRLTEIVSEMEVRKQAMLEEK